MNTQPSTSRDPLTSGQAIGGGRQRLDPKQVRIGEATLRKGLGENFLLNVPVGGRKIQVVCRRCLKQWWHPRRALVDLDAYAWPTTHHLQCQPVGLADGDTPLLQVLRPGA